jgi:hydroxymethylglutaryl-CoA lyase
VALGDTTGVALRFVKKLFKEIREELCPDRPLHDTRGTGLVNYVAAYEAGVRHFDSSFGGVGGHRRR